MFLPSITNASTTTLPDITPGRVLLLVGPQGGGRSTLAATIARRRGSHLTISADALDEHTLHPAIRSCRTLIVEGMPRSHQAIQRISSLARSSGPAVILMAESANVSPLLDCDVILCDHCNLDPRRWPI